MTTAVDPFKGYMNNILAAGRKLRDVALDDNNDLPHVPKALYVTGTGNLKFDPVDGYEDGTGAPHNAPITLAVTAGQLIDWVLVKRVYLTGTTATVLAVLGG